MSKMIETLPLFMRKSKIYNEIFDAEGNQFEKLDQALEDIRLQMNVASATWGLSIFEKEYKISVSKGSTIENRRAAIKAKMRSGGKVDRALLETVASAILNTAVKVIFNGKIEFSFNPDESVTNNLDGFFQVIREIKPAHLAMILDAAIQSKITLTSSGYSFDVPLPITNRFKTASRDGKAILSTVSIKDKSYDFPVNYPVCGQFRTGEDR